MSYVHSLLVFSLAALTVWNLSAGDLRSDFANPPAQWKTRPLWFWNAPPTAEETRRIIEGCHAVGYQGFGILPTEQMQLEFMSPVYLDRYEEAIEGAAALGMKMCLYDEFWFPSGGAGGQLARQHPEALGKRLDLLAVDLQGPCGLSTNVPGGTLMAAVAMRSDFHRVDLRARVRAGRLTWNVPAGRWKIMLFTCVPDGARGLVDYLDPDAVRQFIGLTYEKYYQRLGRHFGRTIDSAFYDEPTFHWIEGGRAWTPSFNQRFQRQHGYDPSVWYPALWFDIGPETAAARNALFGFRAELFANGFVRTVSDWCRAHRIELTGHVDQEEIVNPVGLCGDLMKSMKFQPIPGVDQIGHYGRGSKAYKVISSAAANYDRPRVMTECYGAMELPVPNLYREAMDQFAKGINVMVPHAVWYGTNAITFPPELSFRTPPYAAALPAYNQYVGRLQRLLQQGHPVADVGVLYPIAGLQAGYRFGVGKPYEGGVIPPEADYLEVGERLSLGRRQDFTFLHPEVLDANCRVRGATLRLEHPSWSQTYRVIIVPGGAAMSVRNLRKLNQFCQQGGRVVFTTHPPLRSAEFGKDAELWKLLGSLLGWQSEEQFRRELEARNAGKPVAGEGGGVSALAGGGFVRRNARGGAAYFLPQPDVAALAGALDDALPVPDVGWKTPPRVQGGNLSYLHKTIEGQDCFFFANSSDSAVETTVRLRGRMLPELWDPHTGRIAPAEHQPDEVRGEAVTRLRLTLPPVHSVFVMAPGPSSARPSAGKAAQREEQGKVRAGVAPSP